MQFREVENLIDNKNMLRTQVKEITRFSQTNAVELFHSYTYMNSLIC